jgi:hypothetical protein
MNNKKKVIIGIELALAMLFIIGADWAGETVHRLFHSYFADIIIPFSFYLLLFLCEDKCVFFKKWYIKAGAVFALCALSETLQYFGLFALARVFDPIDYGMYAVGVILAVLFDRTVLSLNFFRSQ